MLNIQKYLQNKYLKNYVMNDRIVIYPNFYNLIFPLWIANKQDLIIICFVFNTIKRKVYLFFNLQLQF